MNANYARFQSAFKIGITFCSISSQILSRKGGDYMLKINYMSTLFVGIDVASKSNVVYAIDFYKIDYLKLLFLTINPVLMN